MNKPTIKKLFISNIAILILFLILHTFVVFTKYCEEQSNNKLYPTQIMNKTFNINNIIRTELLLVSNMINMSLIDTQPKSQSTNLDNMASISTTDSDFPDTVLNNSRNDQRNVYVGSFSITAYTWTGNPMANGEYPYVGCAASNDFPIGTTIYIEGIGTYVIQDVCPTSGVVDLYMNTYDECMNFGRQTANVYIL